MCCALLLGLLLLGLVLLRMLLLLLLLLLLRMLHLCCKEQPARRSEWILTTYFKIGFVGKGFRLASTV